MRLPILLKLVIVYAVFAALSIAVVGGFTYKITYNNTLVHEASKLRGVVQTISDEYSGIYSGDPSADQHYLDGLSNISELTDFDIMIIDTTGAILFDTYGKTTVLPSDIGLAFSGASYYTTGDLEGIFSEDMLLVFSQLTANFAVRGYIFVFEPLSVIESTSNELTRPTYITFLIIFFLSLFLLVAVYFFVHKPIKKITHAAKKYSDGDHDYEISISSKDEFGYLAETLNNMAHELSRTSEYQRQFISNISHDLRSPLTSIKGYVTAMLDGTIPEELREKYLNVVINEADRLQGLTQNVLNLNSVDKYSMYMEQTDFDITQLIRDTCTSFEGRCLERNITFELVFEQREIFVHADRSKIQQVMYNLTDNAIKFSPDEASITIEAFYRKEKVFISVRDHGVGITKENIKKIWTRFYKEDESRGKDKRGTGLGLAIVKEVISAHGENIDVISTEGAGTEFIFSLQKAED